MTTICKKHEMHMCHFMTILFTLQLKTMEKNQNQKPKHTQAQNYYKRTLLLNVGSFATKNNNTEKSNHTKTNTEK